MRSLITLTSKGLYCEPGDFFIDPSQSVQNAVITHAHSDHARRGSQNYWCAQTGVGLLKARLGHKIRVTGVPYREPFKLNSVWVSFYPAGHILGSAQVRIEHGSEVWIASGDYKRDPDPTCEPWEIVPCDTFITEATFGTPAYRWQKNQKLDQQIYQWWVKNAEEGACSLLFGYSLGKTQRILGELARLAHEPILLHKSAITLTQCYRDEGINLARTQELDLSLTSSQLKGRLILAPPQTADELMTKERLTLKTAFASGWMANQGSYSRSAAYNTGFVMSDHADWDDLNQTILESQAKQVFVQHRGEGALVRHLRSLDLEAYPVEVLEPACLARQPLQPRLI